MRITQQTRPDHQLHTDVLRTLTIALTHDVEMLAQRRAYIRLELASLETEMEAFAEVLIATTDADQPIPPSILAALQSLKNRGRVVSNDEEVV